MTDQDTAGCKACPSSCGVCDDDGHCPDHCGRGDVVPDNAVTVTLPVSLDRIASLLACGFEGGVNYWCRIVEYVEPAEPKSHLEGMEGEVFKHVDYPLCAGGAVVCRDFEEARRGDRLVLDFAAVQRGIALMPTKAAYQWGRFMNDDYDADTGDSFIQCCLLGEVIYG